MDDKRFDWLKQDIQELKDEIKAVKTSVDSLNQFKWKAIGSAMAVSFILTMAFQIIGLLYK